MVELRVGGKPVDYRGHLIVPIRPDALKVLHVRTLATDAQITSRAWPGSWHTVNHPNREATTMGLGTRLFERGLHDTADLFAMMTKLHKSRRG